MREHGVRDTRAMPSATAPARQTTACIILVCRRASRGSGTTWEPWRVVLMIHDRRGAEVWSVSRLGWGCNRPSQDSGLCSSGATLALLWLDPASDPAFDPASDALLSSATRRENYSVYYRSSNRQTHTQQMNQTQIPNLIISKAQIAYLQFSKKTTKAIISTAVSPR